MAIPELCEGDFKIDDIATLKTGGEATVLKSHHLVYGQVYIYCSFQFSRDVALKKYQEAFRDDEIKLLKEASWVVKYLQYQVVAQVRGQK